MQKTREPLPTLPGWLSVKDTATLAGRSVSSIRRAITLGDLPARRLQGRILIAVEHGQQFAQLSRTPGQPQPPLSCLEQPTKELACLLVTLTVHIHAGQQEAFEQRLPMLITELPQRFPGSLDRSIKQSQTRAAMVLIMLVWDASMLPEAEERETMLATLRADLAELLDWQTEERYEQQIMLHTL